MRFEKHERAEAFRDTSRKRAALRRKQRLEREALPLFAEHIAEAQPGEDEVMARRAIEWSEGDQRRRDERAAHWRRVRATFYASYGPNLRAALRHAWNRAPYPATWVYFGDMLHSFNQGRLVFADDGRLVSPHHLEWMRNGGTQEARRRLAEAQAKTRANRKEAA